VGWFAEPLAATVWRSQGLFSPKQPGSLTPSARRQNRLQGSAPETAGQFRASFGCSARPARPEESENRASTLRGRDFPAVSGAVSWLSIPLTEMFMAKEVERDLRGALGPTAFGPELGLCPARPEVALHLLVQGLV